MTVFEVPRRAEDETDAFSDQPPSSVVDTSELAASTRRVLLALLRGPYLRADLHAQLWSALIRDEELVRSRLADLYLDLVLDLDARVAFVRNLEVEDAPKVVRRTPLTLLDTALVLFLRRTLLASSSDRVRSYVALDEIEDQLRSYQPADQTDRKGFDDRIMASINRMKKNSILLSTGDDQRWEISPVLALVFGADEVALITEDLTRMAAGEL